MYIMIEIHIKVMKIETNDSEVGKFHGINKLEILQINLILEPNL